MDAVEPILVPLAADAAHPFPFISNLGLNLAVLVTEPGRRNRRFVRIKVPGNRPRWVLLPNHAGWVPLEQVIADNLSVLFPGAPELACFFFRVTRGRRMIRGAIRPGTRTRISPLVRSSGWSPPS